MGLSAHQLREMVMPACASDTALINALFTRLGQALGKGISEYFMVMGLLFKTKFQE
jgi:hypothetical protein